MTKTQFIINWLLVAIGISSVVVNIHKFTNGQGDVAQISIWTIWLALNLFWYESVILTKNKTFSKLEKILNTLYLPAPIIIAKKWKNL